MNGIRTASRSSRKALISLCPALVGLFALTAAPAAAGQCPRGQIYRVSKKACMDRAEAVRLGIVQEGAGQSKPALKAGLPEAQDPGDETSDAALAESPPAPAVAQVVAPYPPSSSNSPPPAAPRSPYGALTLENFARP